MLISLVVAATSNNVIGRDGAMPWHIPEDLARFRRLTMGHPVVMGRRTFESIGRALPGRTNIVISGDPGYAAVGCTVVSSPADSLRAAEGSKEVMIIGGAAIYEYFLPLADRIYLTRIHAELEGDTFFPEPDATAWRQTDVEHRPAGGAQHALTFVTLERRRPHRSPSDAR